MLVTISERLSIKKGYDDFKRQETTIYSLRTRNEIPIATVTVQDQPQTTLDILIGRVRTSTEMTISIEPHFAGAALDAIVSYSAILRTHPMMPEDAKLREIYFLRKLAEELASHAVR